MTSEWLDPLTKLEFFKAFRAKATQLTTKDGRRYKLDYEKEKGKVHVTPIASPQHPSPFVPRGLFDLKVVTHDDWIS